jgi:hypothetical protein
MQCNATKKFCAAGCWLLAAAPAEAAAEAGGESSSDLRSRFVVRMCVCVWWWCASAVSGPIFFLPLTLIETKRHAPQHATPHATTSNDNRHQLIRINIVWLTFSRIRSNGQLPNPDICVLRRHMEKLTFRSNVFNATDTI